MDPFLTHLLKMTERMPSIEAEALWQRDGQWIDAVGETLEAEEIAYYAEGLMEEGFSIAWQLFGQSGRAMALRLLCWQGERAPMPAIPVGMVLLDSADSTTI